MPDIYLLGGAGSNWVRISVPEDAATGMSATGWGNICRMWLASTAELEGDSILNTNLLYLLTLKINITVNTVKWICWI